LEGLRRRRKKRVGALRRTSAVGRGKQVSKLSEGSGCIVLPKKKRTKVLAAEGQRKQGDYSL